MCGLTITPQRKEYIEFSHNLYMDSVTFVLQQAKLSKPEWIMFNSFKWELWISLFISIIVVSFVMNLLIAKSNRHSIVLNLFGAYLNQCT